MARDVGSVDGLLHARAHVGQPCQPGLGLEPAGGSSPSCRARSEPSKYASLWLIRSSLTVKTSQPSMSMLAPLGAKP